MSTSPRSSSSRCCSCWSAAWDSWRPDGAPQGHGAPGRVGPRRTQLRRLDHLVPDRRRPLHGVHVRRRAGADVRRRGGRLLRRAVHHRDLPAVLPGPDPALVGVAPARLRHPRRLRPDPLRLADAGAAYRHHRHRRDNAVHRAPTGRHRGRAQDDGRDRRQPAGPARADHHRVRDPGRVHLSVRAARAGAHRVRQGHADLHRHHRGDPLPALQAGRLGLDLRRRGREVPGVTLAERRHHPQRQQPAAIHHPGTGLGVRPLPVPAQHHGVLASKNAT